jgi:hypothetical protein
VVSVNNQYGDWTGFGPAADLGQSDVVMVDLGIVLHNTWTSFWGQFGLGQIVLPDWLYATLLLINLFCLVGLALYLFRVRNKRAAEPEMLGAIRWKEALILGLLLAAMIAASIWYVSLIPGPRPISAAGGCSNAGPIFWACAACIVLRAPNWIGGSSWAVG